MEDDGKIFTFSNTGFIYAWILKVLQLLFCHGGALQSITCRGNPGGKNVILSRMIMFQCREDNNRNFKTEICLPAATFSSLAAECYRKRLLILCCTRMCSILSSIRSTGETTRPTQFVRCVELNWNISATQLIWETTLHDTEQRQLPQSWISNVYMPTCDPS